MNKFINDREWDRAKQLTKQLGKPNDWVTAIAYYHELGGKQVQLFCMVGEQSERVLDILDSGEVLLQNSITKNLLTRAMIDVEESQKTFFINQEPTPVTKELPNGKTLFGKTEITFYE